MIPPIIFRATGIIPRDSGESHLIPVPVFQVWINHHVISVMILQPWKIISNNSGVLLRRLEIVSSFFKQINIFCF